MTIEWMNTPIAIALAATLLAGCDESAKDADAYLRSRGHSAPACSNTGKNAATCTTDGATYRCVVSRGDGCGVVNVACEHIIIADEPAERRVP